ncbi:MAG: hypothetical protein QOF76_350 [Solirubrobacteraceae bacterium]|nr:hypothetical protein [Solirubrobacteraceae bacterium]
MRHEVACAVGVVAGLGLPAHDPRVLADGSNVLVAFDRAGVVARVPGLAARWRAGDAARGVPYDRAELKWLRDG